MALLTAIQEMRDQMSAYFSALMEHQDAVSERLRVLGLHTVNTANPHRVTKTQVGLGNVQNYAMASRDEAINGVSSMLYMSPLRTKEVMETHTSRVDNPHEVTAAQVGATTPTQVALAIEQDVGKIAVVDNPTILAGGEVMYDLTLILGADHVKYDKAQPVIDVLVLDTQVGSRTENMFINAEAVVTTAVDNSGVVHVMSYADADITARVRITVQRTMA